jgi:hypothetical protein
MPKLLSKKGGLAEKSVEPKFAARSSQTEMWRAARRCEQRINVFGGEKASAPRDKV